MTPAPTIDITGLVAELRALASQATSGKWYIYTGEDGEPISVAADGVGPNGGWVGKTIARFGVPYRDRTAEQIAADAAYLKAAQPAAILALLALIESQGATIERVERERDEVSGRAEKLQAAVNALDQERDGFAQLNAKLKADNKEMGQTFDLRWGATQRAIKRWQADNPGNDLTWPDHADLVVWLLDRVTALEAEKAGLVKAVTPSPKTKAAYIREFHFDWTVWDPNGEEQITHRVQVPWTTIKQIMSAIRAQALSRSTEKNDD